MANPTDRTNSAPAILKYTNNDTIAHIVLNGGACNEIGESMLAALEQVVETLAERTPRAVILRSENPNGFCAGADLVALHEGIEARAKAAADTGTDDGLTDVRAFLDRIHGVMNALDNLPCPLIGAIGGICFGGGFELALTCDVRIAEKNARFCFPELRLGLIPGFGGIPRLRRDLGNAIVRDIVLTGRSINAKKALQSGLVSQVVPRGEALRAAEAQAEQLVRFDDATVSAAKRFTKPIPLEELEEEKEIFMRLFDRDVTRDALRRFATGDSSRATFEY